MIRKKTIFFAVVLISGGMSILANGFLASYKDSQEVDIYIPEPNNIRYSDFTSENMEKREQVADAIRNERKEIIKWLLQLAAQKVDPLPRADTGFPLQYPWHDAKHLSILLLGDFCATEAIPLLLENLEYRNPKSLVVTESLNIGGWYPAAESLSKIGMPAVNPTIKKLSSYEPKNKGSEICTWILKEILGVKLAKVCIQIAIDETKDNDVKKRLSEALSYIESNYGNTG